MAFSEHRATLGEQRTQEFASGTAIDPAFAYRLFTEYEGEQSMEDLLQEYLSDPRAAETTGLLIGSWFEQDDMSDGPDRAIETLIAAAAQLPNLQRLFFGDITFEECEISWINQGNFSALWEAFPRLEELYIRGSNELTLGNPEHDNLQKLVLESGGMPVSVIKELAHSRFPNLEHLEVYLGVEDYGWDGSVEDLKPLLNPELFPKLKYLGLKNSGIQDEVVALVCESPFLAQLEILDLSCGELTDTGGQTLLNCDKLGHLKKLDLHHHFLSNEMMEQLSKLPTEVDVSEQNQADVYGDDVYRYTAVGE